MQKVMSRLGYSPVINTQVMYEYLTDKQARKNFLCWEYSSICILTRKEQEIRIVFGDKKDTEDEKEEIRATIEY